jgi:hypothetical protein
MPLQHSTHLRMLSFEKLGRDWHLPKFRAQAGVLFMSMLEGKSGSGVIQKTSCVMRALPVLSYSAVGFSWPPYKAFYESSSRVRGQIKALESTPIRLRLIPLKRHFYAMVADVFPVATGFRDLPEQRAVAFGRERKFVTRYRIKKDGDCSALYRLCKMWRYITGPWLSITGRPLTIGS